MKTLQAARTGIKSAWVRTEVRLVDPCSGATLDVWFHPQSDERTYVRARSKSRL
jgi:hypothetical protein